MPTVWAEILRRAAEIVGGELSLAAKLKVKPGDLAVWLGAQKTPPPEVFLMAIDLIGERQLEELAKKQITKPSLPSDSGSSSVS